MANAKSPKEIERIVAAYFYNIPHKLIRLDMEGTLARMEISYFDFKPTRQARRDLEDLIPNLESCILYRDFSPEVESDALDEIQDIYIKDEASGEFAQTTIGSLINEVLFSRCLV